MRPRRQTPRSASKGLALVALLVVLLGLLLPAGTTYAATTPGSDESGSPSPSTDAETGTATPLTVRLSALSPGVVRPRGPLELTGRVRNDSDETWTDVNVAPFVGDTAITSREELTLAAESPEETAVGTRLDAPGTFVGVGDLEPGDVVDFTLTVPRDELPPASAPGVYWVGVHALGTDGDGRDSVADGRARTFVPVLPPQAGRTGTADRTANSAGGQRADTSATGSAVPVSLVLPLRQTALRAADGSLAEPEGWVDLTGPDGRLDRLSRFAASAGTRPLTWLVDPAVLDAVSDLGQGNPPLSLGPPERAPDDESPSPDPDASPSASTSPSGDPSDGTEEPSASPSDDTTDDADDTTDGTTDDPGDAGVPDRTEAATARALLDRLVEQLGSASELLATPYADPDAMALLRHGPGLLDRAVTRTGAALDARDLEGRTVVATPSGRADADLLDRLPDDVGLVVSDQGDLEAPVSGLVDGRSTLLVDARAGSGGPGPTPALDPLALRQRILAETSLESTTASATGTTPRPVTVVLPRGWDPGSEWTSADFFDGLDVPWVRWSTPPAATRDLDVALSYPRSLERREITAGGVAAAGELVRSAGVLDDLLANDNQVLGRLTGAALSSVSYGARARSATALDSAEELTRGVAQDLAQVSVLGTDFVTLSSLSGTLTVTVVNDLAQPVTVGVAVQSEAGVEVEGVEPLALGPDQRGSVRLPVSSQEGVHDVTLVPVTTEGQPAGTPFEFVLRTSQVGQTIWYVMGGAGVLFAVTLLRRLRQRLRDGDGVKTRAARAQEAP